ncbi:MAG: GTPase Era, partial [Bacteroidota bacterium]
SALERVGLDQLFAAIKEGLPTHPPYFPAETLTDKPERFFASEIVREKIFLNYKKEVPYSCEVVVTEFKEEDAIIRIRAEIYVERTSQKGILIGHRGEMLKKVGIEARKDLETFFQKQIHLETYVKVEKDWRKKKKQLKKFGYFNS